MMETNAKIIEDLSELSKKCKELLHMIKGKPNTYTSVYMIEVKENTVITSGLHVGIQYIDPERTEDDILKQMLKDYSLESRWKSMSEGERGEAKRRWLDSMRSKEDNDRNSSYLEVSVPKFELIRRPIVTPSVEILDSMIFSLGITPANDLFNDKLDYTCKKYEDLVRISQGMDHIYQKYEFFDEAPKVNPILRTFRDNYTRIESGLQEAWRKIQDEDHAPLTAGIQERLARANEALRAVSAMGAHYVRRDRSSGKPSFCVKCGYSLRSSNFTEGKSFFTCPKCKSTSSY